MAPKEVWPTGKININTATITDLTRIPGLSDNTARMIVAYRNTYGAFTVIDELVDVPGITPDFFAKIRNVITVSESVVSPSAMPSAAVPRSMATSSAGMVDINAAGMSELSTLPGMDESKARMIMAYRQSYGAFTSLDGLLDVPGMTPDIVAGIRARATVGGAAAPAVSAPPAVEVAPVAPAPPPAPMPVEAARVNVNTAGLRELSALPGMDEGKARMVLAYRNSYGDFQLVDELLDVPGMTPQIFGGLRDLITVDGSRAPAAPPAAPRSSPPVQPSPPPSAPPSTAGMVNINSASEAELASIKDFSSQNVKLILAYRASYGSFASVDDLLQVPSINKELLDKVRSRLTVK
jgi:competence ComEA-like helix-hairpin-helix protein